MNNIQEKQRKGFIKRNHWIGIILTILILSIFQLKYSTETKTNLLIKGKEEEEVINGNLCPIPTKVPIIEHEKIQYILHDEEYKLKSANLLSKAVKIDTIVFDEMTMKEYSKMSKFHDYLKDNFPLVFKKGKVSKINEYGLVFEFPGYNKELKPILLLAHQDTVPIGDSNDWNESPLSGRFDGKKIFGRGSTDCKTLLVSLMESVEMIIFDEKDKFERGFILAFGFDEEKSGFDGAYHIGQWLLKKYGPNSIDHLIDEGPMMFLEQFGDYYALIPTGEKGYIDLQIDITTPGGHSSNPGINTSIGIMSKLLVLYEEDLFKSFLNEENPMLGMFECVAEQGRLPIEIKKAAKKARFDLKSNEQLSEFISDQGSILKWMITTTQAIDIIKGGDKANALPRSVKAIINHRINYGEDEFTIWDKAKRHGIWIANKYGLGLEVNGKVIIEESEFGNIIFSAMREPLKPANATPLYDDIYNKFTGTIKSFYEDEVFPELFNQDGGDNNNNNKKKFIIAPAIMTGNTDTRHYWDLTKHIFRVQPGSMDFMNVNIHGPNEFTEIDSHLQQVAFYYNYILDNA